MAKKYAKATKILSDICQTKFTIRKKHQDFERFYVRRLSDKREEVISQKV